MSVELATAYVNIAPSARGFTKNLGKQMTAPLASAGRDAGQQASKQFGSRFSSGLKGALIGGGVIAGIGLLTRSFSGLVNEARESAKIGRLTGAALKSTGGIAGVSAKQIGALATRLSNLSGVDDELIQSGENVLLTFTNVRNGVGKSNKIFDRATEAALNMSAALGQDMQSSVIQLGKALNDPIKGVSALSRVGVSFTQQQKDQIKVLVAGGKTLEAQKIILREVGTEFGGAAKAAADPLERLKVTIGNFKEQVGGALLPVINKAATGLGGVLPQVGGAISGALSPILPVVTDLAKQLVKGLAPVLPELGRAFADVVRAVVPLIPPLAKLAVILVREVGVPTIVAIAKAFAGLATAITPLLENTRIMTPIIVALGSAFVGLKVVKGVQSGLLGLAKAGGTAVGMFQRLAQSALAEKAALIAQKVASFAAAAATKALAVAQGILNAVMDANPIVLVIAAIAAIGVAIFIAYKKFKPFRNIVDAVGRALATAFDFVKRNWKLILGLLLAPFIALPILVVKNFDKIKKVIGSFLAAIVPAGARLLANLVIGLGQALPKLLLFFTVLLPLRIIGALAGLIAKLTVVGVRIMRGLIAGFQRMETAVAKFYLSLPGKIVRFIGNVSKLLFNKGIAIIRGFLNGALAFQLGVLNFYKNLPGRIVTAIGAVGKFLFNKGVSILRGLRDGAASFIPAVFRFFTGLPDKIIEKLGDVTTWLFDVGKDVLKGLLDGIKDAVLGIGSKIADVAGDAKDAVVDGFKGAFGIGSPSKVMADLVGRPLMEGVAAGMTKSALKLRPAVASAMDALTPQGFNASALNVAAAPAHISGAVRGGDGRIAENINIYHVKDNDDAVRKFTWAAKTRGR